MPQYNSNVRLLKDIDLKPDYQHTFKFDDLASQLLFFAVGTDKLVQEFNDLSYIRVNKPFRVEAKKDDIEDANYLLIRNDTGRYYFGFITSIEYVSENASTINWTLDILQTYQFDWKLTKQFVEREHVNNDAKFFHLIPEDLQIGDIQTPIVRNIPTTSDFVIVVGSTVDLSDPAFPDVRGSLVGGIYQGIKMYTFLPANVNLSGGLTDVLNDLTTAGKADAIQFMYMQPSCILDTVVEGGLIDETPTSFFDYVSKNAIVDFDGYVPKNNKLFNFPYNYFTVSAGNAREFTYKYEFFEDDGVADSCKLQVTGSIGAGAVLSVIPRSYKGVTIKFDETITLENLPYCSWSTDYYNNWLAQNQVSNAVAIGGSALSFVGGLITGQPLAIAGGFLGVAQTFGQFYENSIKPNQPSGSLNSDYLLANGFLSFWINHKTITKEYAFKIDQFLSRYGYKINEIKTPNLNSRQNWNYIKLVDANINGNIPQDDLREINNIFNNGVTFWHNDVIGQYDLDNPIVP